MTQNAGQVAHLRHQVGAPVTDFDSASSLPVYAPNAGHPAMGGIENDYLRTMNGLAPRHLRERPPQTDAEKATNAAGGSGNPGAPGTSGGSEYVDAMTALLRQRILEVPPEEPPRRLRSVALPILAALAALPWLAGRSVLDIRSIANMAAQLVLR